MSARQIKPRTTMDKRGRVLLPKIIRDELGVTKEDTIEIEIYGKNKILLTILTKGK